MQIRTIRMIAGIALILICIFCLYRHPELLTSLGHITVVDFIYLVILSILIMFALGIQFKCFILMFNLKLPIHEWFGLTVVNSMLNYYFPAKSGLMMRGAYLKRQYDISLTSYTSSAIVSHLLMLGIVSVLGFLFSMIMASKDLYSNNIILLSFFFGVIALLITCFSLFISKLSNMIQFKSINLFLQHFSEGLQFWKSNKQTLLTFSMLVVLLIFLWGLRLYVCFISLGQSVDFFKIIIIECLICLSFVISVTPGNLGIKEGITVFIANYLNISPSTALLASLIDRSVEMLMVFIIGLIFSCILIRDR